MLLSWLIGLMWDTTMYSAIIAAIVSFVVWGFTAGHENYKKEKEQRRLDNANLTYLSFLLLGALSSANQQMRSIRAYIVDFDEGLNLDYEPLSILPHLDLQTLSVRIDQEKYFTSYINVYKKGENELESIKNIFTTVYFLQIQFNSVLEMTKTFYKDEAMNSQEFSQFFYSIMGKIGDLRFNKSTPEIIQFFNLANELHQEYLDKRQSESDFNSAYYNFIIPILKTIKIDYVDQDFLREIASLLFQVKFLGERLLKNRSSYKIEISSWFNRTVGSVSSLQKNSVPLIRKYTPVNEESFPNDPIL